MRSLYLNCPDRHILDIWGSIFNGVQVISNRETPIHRDLASEHAWYDLLATVGNYRDTEFSMPGVGYNFEYSPGTLIGLCGKLLRHGVCEAFGDRVCIAYYMRSNVQRRLGAEFAGWNSIYNYM